MIPKSPKQAYCTKFLLNTRMQPAGKEKGQAQESVGEDRARGRATSPEPRTVAAQLRTPREKQLLGESILDMDHT